MKLDYLMTYHADLSPRYQWLVNTVAVAEGRVVPGAVEYKVYACRND